MKTPLNYTHDAAIWLVYAFLLAPLVCVIAVSFNGAAVPSFPPSELSLRWYGVALTEPAFVNSLITSLWLGLAATAIAAPLGTLAAVGLKRGNVPGKAFLEALFLAPIVVPGIAIGISLLVAFSSVGIVDGWMKLLIAHVLIVLPYSIRTVLASMARIDPFLEEASLTLGASRITTFFLVTLPIIRPGIVAGAIFSFILSFDDVSVSLFLIDSRTTTLPIAIMNYLEYNYDPSIAAISTLTIVATLLLVVVLERLFGVKKLMGA